MTARKFNRQQLAALIASHRQREGLTQRAAATAAGISQPAWHSAETGETGRVSADTLVRMAAAVGLKVQHVEEFRAV